MKRLALLIAVTCLSAAAAGDALAQYVTYYQPTYYPATAYRTYYAPPVVAPAAYAVASPVTYTVASPVVYTVAAPVVAAPAPVVAYYRPPTVAYQPTARVVTRYRPILGGTVSRVRYGYAPVVIP